MSNQALSSYVDRLIQLEEEKKEASGLIKELKSEIKSSGYDVEGLAEFVRRKMMDDDKKKKAKRKFEAARLYAREMGQLDLFEDNIA